MSAANAIYQIVRADFLERVRRRAFLAVLGFAVYLGYAIYADQITLRVGLYRGEVNAAWIGSLMGMVASVILSLIGFYLVKNCVERDAETRVGAILAATPISNLHYAVSKMLSNFAVLGAMVLILSASAVAIETAHLVSTTPSILPLLLPPLVLGLTSMSVTAALAVTFEVIPVLRGAKGNVLYFFLWTAMLIASVPVAISTQPPGVALSMCDFAGLGTTSRQMQAVVRRETPEFHGGTTLQVGGPDPSTRKFVWNGMEWTGPFVISRLLWIAIAFAVAGVASLVFDRFDPEHGPFGKKSRTVEQEPHRAEPARIAAPHLGAPAWMTHETATPRLRVQRSFAELVVAECRLMILHRAWWWYTVATALFAACLLAPIAWARSGGIEMAWLWPVAVWSQLGTLESRYSTKALVYSAAAILPQQTLAAWLAGVFVTAATGGGLGMHLIAVRDWRGFAAWLSAILFVPALALASGVLTEGARAFEGVYSAWWFLGPVRHGRALDFIGTSESTITPGVYLVAAGILVVFACAWRKFSIVGIPWRLRARRDLRA